MVRPKMGGFGSKEQDVEEGLPVRYARGLSSSEFHKEFRKRRLSIKEERIRLDNGEGKLSNSRQELNQSVSMSQQINGVCTIETEKSSKQKQKMKECLTKEAKMFSVVRGLVGMLGPGGDIPGAVSSTPPPPPPPPPPKPTTTSGALPQRPPAEGRAPSASSLVSYDEARKRFEKGDQPPRPRNKEVFRQMEDLGLGCWNNDEWVPTKVIAPAIRSQVSATFGQKITEQEVIVPYNVVVTSSQ